MATISDGPEKICSHCLRVLPPAAFRLRRRGSNLRQGRCRQCYNRYMREYRGAKRSKTLARFAADLRRENDWQKVEALCGGMFRRFGGVDGFSRAWAEEIQNAQRTAPGSKRVFDSFFAVLHLAEVCDAQRHDNSDIPGMTDEELRAEYDRRVENAALRLLGLG